MAELLVKIQDRSSDNTDYKDGDILCAFNDKRIKIVHAEHVCHYKRAGRNNEGLIIPGHTCQDWFENTHQYKFERVSKTQVKRTNLFTKQIEIFGKPEIDVELFIHRRRLKENHRIFGHGQREIWYGGKINLDEANIDKVWESITNKTGFLVADYNLWPMGRLDIKHHLAVRTQNFNDTEAIDIVTPEYQLKDGRPVLDQNGDKVVVKRRKNKVDWRDLLTDLEVTEQQVLDKNYSVGRERMLNRKVYESKEQRVQASEIVRGR